MISIFAQAPDSRARIAAAAVLLDRAYGKAGTETRIVDLLGKTLTIRARAVVGAAAAGHISPGEAAQLVGAISSLARLIETDDLIARVKEVEILCKR